MACTATIFYIFGQATATWMSSMLDDQYRHDQITRLLSQSNFDSRMLWKKVKSTVRQIEQEDAVLIIDDTIRTSLTVMKMP